MPESSIAIPVSMLLPIGGAIVATLGWLFNLQGKVKSLGEEFAAYKATQAESSSSYRAGIATELQSINAAKHDHNNRLHTVVGRLDLCEERHRNLVAEHRRELQRMSMDHTLSGQLARMQRSLQAGKVVTLESALADDDK